MGQYGQVGGDKHVCLSAFSILQPDSGTKEWESPSKEPSERAESDCRSALWNECRGKPLAEGVDDGLVGGFGIEVGVEEQGVVLGSPGVLCHC